MARLPQSRGMRVGETFDLTRAMRVAVEVSHELLPDRHRVA